MVIVPGGGAGVGRATCLGFAREGAAVGVVDLRGADAASFDNGAIIDVNGGRL